MGNITLTTKEYEELKHQANMYSTLWLQIKSAFKVSYDGSNWRPVGIKFEPDWTEEQQKDLAYCIGLKLSRLNSDAFAWMSEHEECVLDLEQLCIDDMPYGGRLYKGQWDLREMSEEFANAYGQAEVERELALEQKKAEEQKEDEE
jgi:hypothetical protein